MAWRQSRSEIDQLKAATRTSGEQLARVIVGEIETAMLQGEGILVKDQVKRTKAALTDVEIKIRSARRRGVRRASTCR